MSGLGRQMAAAQARYDAMEPPEFFSDDSDDETLTEEQADEQARAEVMGTPEAFADTLAKLAAPVWSPGSAIRENPGSQVHDVDALCNTMPRSETVAANLLQTHELVAILALGDDRHALAALSELRFRVAAAMAGDIKKRAAELLAAEVMA